MSYAIRASCVAFSVFTCFPSTAQPQVQNEFDLKTSGDAAPGSLLWAIRQQRPEVAALVASAPRPAPPPANDLFAEAQLRDGDARAGHGSEIGDDGAHRRNPGGEVRDDSLSASVVPEPTTLWLLLAGLLGIVGLKGRRQSRF